MIIDNFTSKQLENLIRNNIDSSRVYSEKEDGGISNSSNIKDVGTKNSLEVQNNISIKTIQKSTIGKDVSEAISKKKSGNEPDNESTSEKSIESKIESEIDDDTKKAKDKTIAEKTISTTTTKPTDVYSLANLIRMSSYSLGNFSPYNMTVKNTSYTYSGLGDNNAFVPKLQTFYARNKKESSGLDDRGKDNRIDMVDYQDIKEKVRTSKMNVSTENNYMDPDVAESFKLWSMFSFNFNMTSLMYNHFSM